VEKEGFSEVHGYKLDRSGGGLGTRTGAKRGFGTNCPRAGRIRGEESLRAVATCYRWTSGEFVRVRKAADGGRRW
jgi:hypothetical protein